MKYLACILATMALLVTFTVAANASTLNVGAEGREVMRELTLEGRTVLFPTTREKESAIINHELVYAGNVPILITTYYFDGVEYDVFRLMEDTGRGVLRILPPGQQVESSCLAVAFGELIYQRTGRGSYAVMESHDMHYVPVDPFIGIPLTNSGSHDRTVRRTLLFGTGNLSVYDMRVTFDWEMRHNTNWANPLWDWQRITVSRLVVHVFPVGTAHANLTTIYISVCAVTYGTVGMSYSISWPPSVSLSPDANSHNNLVRVSFENAIGVTARYNRHRDINIERAIPGTSIPFDIILNNWASLQFSASFRFPSGFYSYWISHGVRFRHTLVNPLTPVSFTP